MHYCTLLFTKARPTEDQINEILEPYSEDDFYSQYSECEDDDGNLIPEMASLMPVRPTFLWDWFSIGGRYDSILKWDFEKHYQKINEKYGMWFCGKKRNHILFESSKLTHLEKHLNSEYPWRRNDPVEETEWFHMMGAAEGYIRVDGCPVDELHESFIKEDCCYQFVRSDGSACARSVWNGNDFVDTENFAELLAEYWKKAEADNLWVTVLDIHD